MAVIAAMDVVVVVAETWESGQCDRSGPESPTGFSATHGIYRDLVN